MSEPQRAPAGHHFLALDGLRGFAVLWVILHNASDQLPSHLSGVVRLYAVLVHPGWIGVQLFFALSGFLITGGLLDTQRSPHYFSNFYGKRALRILPLYYTVLLGLLLATPFAYPGAQMHGAVLNQLWLWTFTGNWTALNLTGFTHFWSLAVEEQFYLIWPLVVLRLRPRALLKACIGIAATALIIRCAFVLHGASSDPMYYYTVCRMDALALGAAGAALMRIESWKMVMQAHLRAISLAVLAAVAVTALVTNGFDFKATACETFGYGVLALGCATLVTGCALAHPASTAPIMILMRWLPLRSCGKYSYAMYVVHFPIHKLLGGPVLKTLAPGGASGVLAVGYAIVLVLVSYLLGMLSYWGLESRFLALKNRLPGAARPATST